MNAQDQVSDSSDWLDTPVASLGPLETSLRCQICKDFYDAPVITACSHTFCSACIRRSLSAVNAEKKCPLCWAPFEERQLRKNAIVEDLVRIFTTARPDILDLGRKVARSNNGTEAKVGRKRKITEVEEDAGTPSSRKTRSQSRRSNITQPSTSPQPEELLEDDENQDTSFEPEDGLAACPICQKRMPEVQVYAHLDTHQDGEPAKPMTRDKSSTPFAIARRSATPTMQPLPTIAYGVLNDKLLRNKLAELGISNAGPKQLLMKRHMEWRNLVNANCDSSTPKSKRELLKDLAEWEKSQGSGIPNGVGKSGRSSVMEKDFDRGAWSQSHGNNFRDLIAQARAKAKAPKSATDIQEEDVVCTSQQKPSAVSDAVAPAMEVSSTLHPSVHSSFLAESNYPNYNQIDLSKS